MGLGEANGSVGRGSAKSLAKRFANNNYSICLCMFD